MLRREMHVADAALVGNLMQIVLLDARTTIFDIAGVLTVLGTLDRAMLLTEKLAFAHESSRAVWELKLVVVLGILVYALYFGLSAVAWFIQAWVFIALTTMIVLVLYRRDFRSPTLMAFRDES